MTYVSSFPARKIKVNGAKKLYFGGTAYLGLQKHKKFLKIYFKNIKKYGTNYGASRKSNIKIDVYDETEKYLAKLVGSKACVTLSSGYLAGQLACNYFKAQGHSLFYAPNSHTALHQNNSSNYASYSDLAVAVENHIKKSNVTPVVFLDSLDFYGLNYPNFKGLQQLPLDKIIVVADDSHTIGLPLNNGTGCYAQLHKLNPKELIVCSSLGKGFAVQAGAIFGTTKKIEELKNTAFFGGASPATPANIATIVTAENIYKKRQQKLKQHIQLFLKGLNNKELFTFMPNHSAFTYSDQKITTYLKEHNIIVTSFNYPDKDSPTMSRIVLSAHHKKKDINKVVSLINTLYD
ncbi:MULTISPECIES: aminotransferase class I/II-fold pyridoxal phosphate-dependent enzyme [unclassified Cellulophaga]|uniref:aminotransferase class I/II-fold pyridoxal phosphate-dependent enzyme n=1 Tax=unclassified Cellulophaga TaxID=2634405 RepID=UPI0026E14263|nr:MULTISPECIES: aminotransferase class I/II-fold pyridoxal phosphate-dependent enzyme [unclassified Cellulophaga]MDO6492278.1 aminotransferase class I/II-fold pyridoxal phosphate-dependent enzyme [Cellulophaga sp. 2_MG-2023]MDO6493228.1 aminotransferase class I/II-fold pyridoxal phosphate-dependent enzyme [Cellulophaga sp. 3_MG-2023]